MTLPQHPTAIKMAVEKFALSSHRELSLLVEALRRDPDSLKFNEVALVETALSNIRSIVAVRGLLSAQTKPVISNKTH